MPTPSSTSAGFATATCIGFSTAVDPVCSMHVFEQDLLQTRRIVQEIRLAFGEKSRSSPDRRD